jgi:hypothetical protein
MSSPRVETRVGAGAPLTVANPEGVARPVAWSELPDLSGVYDGEAEELLAFKYVGPARLTLEPHPEGGYGGRIEYADPHYLLPTGERYGESGDFGVRVPVAMLDEQGRVVLSVDLLSDVDGSLLVRANTVYHMLLRVHPVASRSGAFTLLNGAPLRTSGSLASGGVVLDREPNGLPEAKLRFHFWPSN